MDFPRQRSLDLPAGRATGDYARLPSGGFFFHDLPPAGLQTSPCSSPGFVTVARFRGFTFVQGAGSSPVLPRGVHHP